MGLLITIAVLVLIVGFIIGSYVRRRSISFEGTVIDKDIRETEVSTPAQNNTPGTISLNDRSGLKHDYMIKVQTTAGKAINWKVTQGKYEIIKIGDHISKLKGTTDITITPQTPQPPVAPTNPTV